jgi:threonine/homoserine/homoserine lactone efflux protein
MPSLRLFMTGMLISFLGTLPMGTLNISAMQISLSDGIRPALYFSAGAVLVEIIYVRFTLVAMHWFRKHKRLLLGLEWFTLVIILALAASSFYTALNPSVNASPILSNTIHRFWLGVVMSTINPLQVPFWFGWSTILASKNLLLPKESDYITYIAGIGIGTIIGHCIFIFGGRLVVEKLNTRQDVVNLVIGLIFLVTAIIQAVRMTRHKDLISTMEEENS